MTLLTRKFSPTSTMPDLAEFYTTQQAAKKLGYTVQGVSRLIREKRLTAIRFGKMYLVSKESVKTYEETTKGKSKNDPQRGKQKK